MATAVEHHYRPSVHYHMHIHNEPDGWYVDCPEHAAARTGPFRDWELAMDLANLHMRNFNHY
jgi:hypothetical protein